MVELKTISDDGKLRSMLKLIKPPTLMWQVDVNVLRLHTFYKGGVIDDATKIMKVGDVFAELTLNSVKLIGVLVVQRIGDLVVFECASATSINSVVMLESAEKKRRWWARLHDFYLNNF